MIIPDKYNIDFDTLASIIIKQSQLRDAEHAVAATLRMVYKSGMMRAADIAEDEMLPFDIEWLLHATKMDVSARTAKDIAHIIRTEADSVKG